MCDQMKIDIDVVVTVNITNGEKKPKKKKNQHQLQEAGSGAGEECKKVEKLSRYQCVLNVDNVNQILTSFFFLQRFHFLAGNFWMKIARKASVE